MFAHLSPHFESPKTFGGLPSLTAIALTVAVSLGFLIGAVPPNRLFIAVAIAIALLCGALYPLAGMLFGLALVFEVVPTQWQYSAPLGQGSIKLYDIWFAFLAFFILLRAFLGEKRGPLLPLPFGVAIVFFMVLVSISLAYSFVFLGNKGAVSEARELIFWWLLPMLVVLLDCRERVRQFVHGLIWIAVALSVLALSQSLLSTKISAAMRVAPLSEEFFDVTRVITGGGIYIVAFALIYSRLGTLTPARRQIWHWPLTLLLLASLLVSFGRAVWIATFIGMFTAVLLLCGWRGAVRTVFAGVVLMTVLLIGLSFLRPAVVWAFLDRGAGIRAEITNGSSFKWRSIENREAINVISTRPLLGVGIGGDYKKYATSDANFDIEKRYIHSAYVFFPLKFGLMGIAFPILVIGSFVFYAFRAWKASPPDRALLAATIGAFVVPTITSFTQPEWVKVQGIASLCCFIALLCSQRAQVYEKVGQ